MAKQLYSSSTLIAMISQYVPNLLIAKELRWVQQRHSWATTVGDVFSVCFVLLFLLATGIIWGNEVDSAFFRIGFILVPLANFLTIGMLCCYTSDAITRGILKLMGRDSTARYAVFLSHDWGSDGLNRSNHERVAAVNDALCAAGLTTWFDSDRMTGDINAAMTEGIDHSDTVVVCVTRNYLLKVCRMPRCPILTSNRLASPDHLTTR